MDHQHLPANFNTIHLRAYPALPIKVRLPIKSTAAHKFAAEAVATNSNRWALITYLPNSSSATGVYVLASSP